ncbi:helix-turn-helix domain-containing protein [Kordiimonas lipolytica]|uniref:Helix-turn-helix domain-containing protein n=1 Tax=Kordiimonas lipolytica TaxID=1662421 RepID=A0ABV8UE57_9PROT|nr:helix-turn-helix transcriptional regulator [Kordiimonas lipolytica]
MAAGSRKSLRTPGQQQLQKMLKEAREKANLPQTAVAEHMGLVQADISKIESGERRLDVIEFIKLSEIIGLDINTAIESIRLKMDSTSIQPSNS